MYEMIMIIGGKIAGLGGWNTVLKRMIKLCLFKEKIFEEKFKEMKELSIRVSGGKTLQAEEAVVLSLRQKHA